MKIACNAGHGAGTPGKRSPDGIVREWAINDKVVDELIKLAKEYQGVETLRIDDPTGVRDVPLAERVSKAGKWGADLYVSIHQNAAGAGWSTARGTEVFTYSAASKEATAVAKSVQSQIVSQLQTKNRGVKHMAFYELKFTKMPAILVECEFMSNRDAATWMMSANYGKQMAAAIMDGIARYYGLKKKAVTAPKPTTTTKPATTTGSSADKVHRVIVDGKQVGAYGSNKNVAEQVEKSLASNPKLIRIERVD